MVVSTRLRVPDREGLESLVKNSIVAVGGAKVGRSTRGAGG